MTNFESHEIEARAIWGLQKIIIPHERMRDFFEFNDKMPYWDGYIWIYTEEGRYKGTVKRIPVQIKGKNDSSLLSHEEISYPVQIDALNAYKTDNGMLYLVVVISDDIEQFQVFYKQLNPQVIDTLIDGKQSQKTINIRLQVLDRNDSTRLFQILEALATGELYSHNLNEKQAGIFISPNAFFYKYCYDYIHAIFHEEKTELLQFCEIIIDLLLEDYISPLIKTTKKYHEVSLVEKRNVLSLVDESISKDFDTLFAFGIQARHRVLTGSFTTRTEYNIIVETLRNIIHRIFLHYFLDEHHKFGTENIYTAFSLLPISTRITIMENIWEHYQNLALVDRLSLAYVKNDELEKSLNFINTAFEEGIITSYYKSAFTQKAETLRKYVPKITDITSDIENRLKTIQELGQDKGPEFKKFFDLLWTALYIEGEFYDFSIESPK